VTQPEAQGAPLLHVDLVLLRDDIDEGAREGLRSGAGALATLPGVLSIFEIEAGAGSDFDRAYVFTVGSLSDLEAFGTDPRYIRFLQGGLARAMRSFGGCDVQLQGPLPPAGDIASCLALAASPQTYDWQVREALTAWAPSGAVGLAIGERQRYRGLGLMFSDQPVQRPATGFEGFGLDFISGALRGLS
jgi:hypothetical protein